MQPGVEGDDFLSGLLDMGSVVRFSNEYTITRCAHVWVARFCLVSVLPHGGGGGGWVWQNSRVGGCPTPPPPPPRGGVGLCGGPWVYRASATSFFLLLQVPCNMFIYGVFTWHCISRVHAPRP